MDIPPIIKCVCIEFIRDDENGLSALIEFYDYPKILKISTHIEKLKLPYRVYSEAFIWFEESSFPLNDGWLYFYKIEESDYIDEFYNVYGDEFKVERYRVLLVDYNFEFLSFIDNPPKVEWIDMESKL